MMYLKWSKGKTYNQKYSTKQGSSFRFNRVIKTQAKAQNSTVPHQLYNKDSCNISRQEQKERPMEHNRKPINRPMHLWGTSSIPKEVRMYNGEKTASSVSGAVKIRQ